MPLSENISLKSRHTFKMDVNARYWADYESVDELRAILSDPQFASLPKLAVGSGSNLLFRGNYPGLLLHSVLKSIDTSIQTDSSVLVKAGSGVIWDDLVDYCVENGWSGMENLSGIPGEVGASPVQNIGAYGSEAKDCIDSVNALDLETLELKTFSNKECAFGYRDSIFKNSLKNRFIVCSVTFKLSTEFNPNINYGGLRDCMMELGSVTLANVRKAVLQIRNSKLPDCNLLGNAGSFFMNPEITMEQFSELLKTWPEIPSWPLDNGKVKISAAWCIEKSGWKGRRLRDAAVHDKQALVLINLGNATSSDIIELCDLIVGDVRKLFGVSLHPEVIFV